MLAGSGDATTGNLGLTVTQQSPAAKGVLVSSGAANVNGTIYTNDANVSLSVDPNASGLTRIDTIILRKDVTAQTVRLVVLQGTPAASPVPPTLTQSASIWEIPLADLTLANGYATVLDSVIVRRHQFANAPEGVYLYGLKNTSGSTLPPGTFVRINSAGTKEITNTCGIYNINTYPVLGVTVDYVPNNGYCRILHKGIGYVRTTGAISIGNRLRPNNSGIGAKISLSFFSIPLGDTYQGFIGAIALAASAGASGVLAYVNFEPYRLPLSDAVFRNNGANYTTNVTTFPSNFVTGVGVALDPDWVAGTPSGHIWVAISGAGECLAGNFIYFDILDGAGNPMSGFTNGVTFIRGLGAATAVPFSWAGLLTATPGAGFSNITSLNLGWRVNAGTGTLYSTGTYGLTFSVHEA